MNPVFVCVDPCINRNILECKGVYIHESLFINNVLIETYWNVKKDVIDAMQKTRGINRNILECKELLHGKGRHKKDRINRNILECKGMAVILSATSVSVLIETYWNVK